MFWEIMDLVILLYLCLKMVFDVDIFLWEFVVEIGLIVLNGIFNLDIRVFFIGFKLSWINNLMDL